MVDDNPFRLADGRRGLPGGGAVSMHASFYEKVGYDEFPKLLNNSPRSC